MISRMLHSFECIICLALLQALVHWSYGQSAAIIQPPETQVILTGMIANFNCTASGIAMWRINGNQNEASWPSGVNSTLHNEIIDPQTYATTTILALQVAGLPANNGTRIECFAYSSSVDTSPAAFVIIAGPPLPPQPKVALLNATALRVSWDKPFTWTTVADILNYTVRMYNSSGDQWMNWTVGPSVYAFGLVNGKVANQCAELIFDISAINVVGESQSIPAIGGFPIVIQWSDQNGTARLSTLVNYNNDGTTSVTVRVQPPVMCSYQIAKYDVTISDILAGTQVAAASVIRAYGNGEHFDISIRLNLAIKEVRTYYTVLGVSSVGFTSLQAIATFNVSPTLIPTNISKLDDTGESHTRILVGVLVGVSSLVLLLILLAVILFTVCRLKKARTLKRESVTDHHYQEHPVAKSESFIRSHPPSEPIYEHINDCPAQSKECIFAAEEKEGGRSLKCGSTQFLHPGSAKGVVDAPPLPLFIERARHTPDGDYVEMKVVAEPLEDSNCGGFSIPCGHLRETL